MGKISMSLSKEHLGDYAFSSFLSDSVDRDQVKVSSKQRNPRKPKDVKKGPMLPETKQLLDDFYRPFNTRLAHLLNNERYLWL